jgi:cysteine desulfurase/selenocysteine lyase
MTTNGGIGTSNCASDFGPFGDRVWLNCAHQGPLPRVAVLAAREALKQKANPHLIADDDFTILPNALKASLGNLIGAAAEDIILGNSASYGLHVLRNGIRWQAGDEVLLVHGDFPATIYPWLGLRDFDVQVKLLTPRGPMLTPDELKREITPSTRLLCVSWVNSFNGSILDLAVVGQLCREHGVIFAINGSQGVGALQMDVGREPIDALISCGYKWLCGPYGTGFCWIRPELRDQLKPNQTYWLPHVWGDERMLGYALKSKAEIGSAAFDLFCTANFMNFMPWRAAIDYLLGVGLQNIQQHNAALRERFVPRLKNTKYIVISPPDPACRSSIVVISHTTAGRNSQVHARLAEEGIDVALRNNSLRFSLHLFNAPAEVDRAISVLESIG